MLGGRSPRVETPAAEGRRDGGLRAVPGRGAVLVL